MKIKVSIITVCLNSAKTIEQTIRSVIEQSYPNTEYIIIDGGSSDGTLDIIRKYEKHIACWVSEPDSGIYDAMNKGIAKATGDIIGIINSDDWYAENALDIVARCFGDSPEIDLAHGDLVNVYDDGFQRVNRGASKETPITWYFHPTVFVKKNIYEQFGVFDLKYRIAADAELMLRFRFSGIKITYIPQVLAYFRNEGVTALRKWKTFIETKRIIGDCIIKNKFSLKQIEESISLMHYSEFYNVFQYICMRMERNKRWGDCLHEILQTHNKDFFVLWGAGDDGSGIARAFGSNDRLIRFFVDSDSEKQQHPFCGRSVFPPSKISKEALVIVATNHYKRQIAKELERKGYRRWIDYLICDDFFEEACSWYARKCGMV